MNPYQHRVPGQGHYGAPPQHLPNNPYTGAAAASAMRNALANPYAVRQQQQQFFQQPASWGQGMYAQPTYVTAEGYTVSSTYAPSYAPPPQQHYSAPMPMRGRGVGGRGRGSHPQHQHANNSQQNHPRPYQSSAAASWGSSRCTHAGCTFAGSAKSVEIHMMDRHLIYPPGHRKRKGDWDADPSLNNGKPVPIPGTGIVLDTPEAVTAWIAERKKRFPTAQRVAEKKQQLREAKARGDIVVADSERRANKRRRVELEDEHQHRDAYAGRGRGRGRGRGNARGARGAGRGGPRGAAPPRAQQQTPARRRATAASPSSSDSDTDSSSSSESDSDSDMDPVRDAVSSKRPPGDGQDQVDVPVDTPTAEPKDAAEPKEISAAELALSEASNRKPPQPASAANRPRPRQPRPPPRNPFGHRPSLLRNLLMPEIRSTVSNLSQAIRFVVQNDFFDGVELKPGDATRRLVEVLDDREQQKPAPAAQPDNTTCSGSQIDSASVTREQELQTVPAENAQFRSP